MTASSGQEQAQGPAFDEVWERVKTIMGLKTQTALAQALGVHQTAITDAKKRGFFPLGWIYRLGHNYNISYDELLRGTNVNLPTDTVPEVRTLYIDSAVEVVENAVKASGCRINSEQKKALTQIIREELKKKAENLIKALTI